MTLKSQISVFNPKDTLQNSQAVCPPCGGKDSHQAGLLIMGIFSENRN